MISSGGGLHYLQSRDTGGTVANTSAGGGGGATKGGAMFFIILGVGVILIHAM